MTSRQLRVVKVRPAIVSSCRAEARFVSALGAGAGAGASTTVESVYSAVDAEGRAKVSRAAGESPTCLFQFLQEMDHRAGTFPIGP